MYRLIHTIVVASVRHLPHTLFFSPFFSLSLLVTRSFQPIRCHSIRFSHVMVCINRNNIYTCIMIIILLVAGETRIWNHYYIWVHLYTHVCVLCAQGFTCGIAEFIIIELAKNKKWNKNCRGRRHITCHTWFALLAMLACWKLEFRAYNTNRNSAPFPSSVLAGVV